MSTPQRPTKPLPQESAALLRSLTDHVNDESLQTLFNEVDTDNSGLVELNEVTDLLVKIYRLQTYGGVDITAKAGQMAEALIAAADENNDGKLQFDEFKRAIKIVAEGQ